MLSNNECFIEARNQLRRMREDQVRDGQTVVSLWENVLMTERNKLGDECKPQAHSVVYVLL